MSANSKNPHHFESENVDYIWQDRDVRFDSKGSLLDCRKGEKIIDSINSVEDTKGNNGERGSLIVTNLRLIWVSHAKTRVNLSIGYSCMVSATIRKAKSKLRGDTQALCILAKFGSKFEFVFTSLVKNSPRLFTTVQAVLRAYESSKLYRDLKLRGSIVRDNELILLPLEQIYTKISGVWNLSSDQGNLGTFFLTNVRVVWHANLASNFNVSVPYMQIKQVRVRESKFGRALVIETFSRAGGYILGFRIDPIERLDEVIKELKNLHIMFSSNPIFGLEFTIEDADETTTGENNANKSSAPYIRTADEDVEYTDDYEDAHVIAAYYAYGTDAADESNQICFDTSIGLAVEKMQDGISLESLWRVI